MSVVAPERAVARDAAHRYWFPDQREAIGVTTALKVAGLIDDRFFTEEATLRGTAVHQALETLDRGEGEIALTDETVGYIDAYEKFLRECQPGPVVLNEAILGDDVLGYAGTVDRVRYVGPHLAVIDFKTGAACSWHRIQSAAYAHLVKAACHHAVVRRFGLYLRADGTYTFTHYADRSDWDVFRAALCVAQFQRAHGWRSR